MTHPSNKRRFTLSFGLIFSFSLFILSGLSVLSMACGNSTVSSTADRPLGEACTSHDDCISDLVCYQDVCRQQCIDDSDCNEAIDHCDEIVSVCVDGSTIECGNGEIEPDEGCDDGNNIWHDGCSASCEKEEGWLCYGAPSVCSGECGDGIAVDTEECDDANLTNGDGCSAQCETENGWSCDDDGENCTTLCGDTIQAGEEACDDGNTNNGDGCSATCALEGISGAFTDVTNAALSTEYSSEVLTILPTDSDVQVVLSGGNGTEKLFKNNLNTGALSATYTTGDLLSVSMESSDLYLTQISLTISIDNLEITWSITTTLLYT